MQQSQALVSIVNKTPLADSREIAKKLDIEHHNFFAMVKKYQDEVSKDFGEVLFDSEPLPSGQKQFYALLTEDQSYVYLAYSQNTERARTCKRLLVKAFAEARTQLAQPQAAPALPEPIKFHLQLTLNVDGFEDIERNQLILAQAEKLRDMAIGKVSKVSDHFPGAGKMVSETKLIEAPNLRDRIIKKVGYLQAKKEPSKLPTFRDFGRHFPKFEPDEIEQEVTRLVAQELLETLPAKSYKDGEKNYRYQLTEQGRLLLQAILGSRR